MNCEQYQDLMMSYMDEMINDIDLAKLKQHTRVCRNCEEEFEGLKRAMECVETLGFDIELSIPETFEQDVMLKIHQLEELNIIKQKEMIKSRRTLIIMGGTVGIAAFVSFIIFMGTLMQQIGLLQVMGRFAWSAAQFVFVMASLAVSVSAAVLNTYYYVFVLLFVLLFAGERTFDVMMKRNQGGAIQ